MAEEAGPSKTAVRRSLELGSYFTPQRLRDFSLHYRRYPQLWGKDDARRRGMSVGLVKGACSGLAGRAGVQRGGGTCKRVLSLCRHFHRLLFQELLIACRRSDKNAALHDAQAISALLPAWARHADTYLGMTDAAVRAYKVAKNKKNLTSIMESATIPMPTSLPEPPARRLLGDAAAADAGARLVRAMRRERRAGVQAALHAACRRHQLTPGEANKLWSYLRSMAYRKLGLLLRHSDRADNMPKPPSALDWAAADLSVYFGVSILKLEHLKEDSCLLALLYTFHLVQRRNLEPGGAPPAPALWAAAAAEYSRSGHTCSALVLQRRWYELKRATRQALLAAWHNDSWPAPPPLLRAIARRYPHVVTEPECSWAELVARGAVARPTSERGPLPGDERAAADSSDAESGSDDLILVEETIETITLDEENDPKTPVKNMSSEPKSPTSKNMPFIDLEETLSNPFPPDEDTESLNNDPIFNENEQSGHTELQCDAEITKSPHSDDVVEALKSLDVGAVQMSIRFDDDDEFDDANDENERGGGGGDIHNESVGGNNDVTVKDKNQATKSKETVNKTCDSGNDNLNMGLLKIGDVISMQVESSINKTPAIKRTDENKKGSNFFWSQSSDSDSDNLTIDPDYVPRDVSEDIDRNQRNYSHAQKSSTHSSNDVANNNPQNNSMVLDMEKVLLVKMLKESKSVHKDTLTPDSENTIDEEVSNKIDKSNDDSFSGIDEKLDLDYVRCLVGNLLQSYGCNGESNEISKTDEPMSDKCTANVPSEAARSGHVPNLRKLCKNKIGSLLTSVKSNSSNNETTEVNESKTESNLTEAATKIENDKHEQERPSFKCEVQITNHISVSERGVNETERPIRERVIRKTAQHLYTGPKKVQDHVKEIKFDLKVKPVGWSNASEEAVFMAPNKEIVVKCATKSIHNIAKPKSKKENGNKGSETSTSKDTTDSQTDLAKSTENVQELSPTTDNIVKGHVIRNPILLRMLKSQSCDANRSLQFASTQNKYNNNATDIQNKADDDLMIEDEVESEIDSKLILFPVVELEKVNLALMLRHWRQIRRISLYDVPPTYLFKKNNLTLLKKCRPCRVPLERPEWGERGSVGSERERVAKKVELQNIDDVRRNNRNILTAQVAPISVDSSETQAAARQRAKLRARNAGLSADNLRTLLQRYSDCETDNCAACARCLARPTSHEYTSTNNAEKERRNRARLRHKERNRKRSRSPYEQDPEEAKRRWIREKNIAAEKFGVKPRVLKKKAVEPPPAVLRWIREKNVAAEKFGVKPRVLKKKAVDPPPAPAPAPATAPAPAPAPAPATAPAPLTQTFGHLIMSSIGKIDLLNRPSGKYVINIDGSIRAVDLPVPNTNNNNSNISNTNNINSNISNTSHNPPTVPLILNQTTNLQPPTFLPLTVEHLLEQAKNQPIFKLDSNLFNPHAVASINKTLNNLTETEVTEFNPVITNVQSLADADDNKKKQNLLNNIVQIRKRLSDSTPEDPPKKVLATLPRDEFPGLQIVTKNIEIRTNNAQGEVKRDRRSEKKIPTVPNLIPITNQTLRNEAEIARRQLSNLKCIKVSNVRRPSLEITSVQAGAPPTTLNQTNLQTVQTCSQINLKKTQTNLQPKNAQGNMQHAQRSQSNMQKTTTQTNLPNAQNSRGNLEKLAPKIIRQVPSCDMQSIQACLQTNLQNAQSSNSMQTSTPPTNLQNIQDSPGNLQTIDLQNTQNVPWNVQSVQISPQTNLQNAQTSNCNTQEATPPINLLNTQSSQCNVQSIRTVSQTNLQCVQNPQVSLPTQTNSQMNFQNVKINQQINLQNIQTNSQINLENAQTNYIWSNTQSGGTVDLTTRVKILNPQLPINQQFNTVQQVSNTLNSNFNVILSNSHQNALQVNSVQAGPSVSYLDLPNQLGLLSNQVMPLNAVQAGPSNNSVLVVPAQDNLNTVSPQLFGPVPLQVTSVQAGPSQSSLQDGADKHEETLRSVTERRRVQYCWSSNFFHGRDVDPQSVTSKTAAEYISGRDPTSLVVLAGHWPVGATLLLREPTADVAGPVFGLAPPCRIIQQVEETPASKSPEQPKSKPPWLKVRSFARMAAAPPERETLSSSGGRLVAPRRVFLHDKVYHKLSDSPLTYAKVLTPVESPQELRSLVGKLRPLFVYSMAREELYTVQPELSSDGANIIISGAREINPVVHSISRHVLSQGDVEGVLHGVSHGACAWMVPRRDVVGGSDRNTKKPRILNEQLPRGPRATPRHRPVVVPAPADTVIDLDSD